MNAWKIAVVVEMLSPIRPFPVVVEQAESAVGVWGDVVGNWSRCHKPKLCCNLFIRHNYFTLFHGNFQAMDDSPSYSVGNSFSNVRLRCSTDIEFGMGCGRCLGCGYMGPTLARPIEPKTVLSGIEQRTNQGTHLEQSQSFDVVRFVQSKPVVNTSWEHNEIARENCKANPLIRARF
jgi:hypothetical protein